MDDPTPDPPTVPRNGGGSGARSDGPSAPKNDRPPVPKNDRRTIFGWAMYDWANSAYVVTTTTAILPFYFQRTVVGPGGWEAFGTTIPAASLWGYLNSYATLVIFLLAPVLGAIADFSGRKKRFLQVFAYGGAVFATTLALVGTGDVVLAMGLFFLAQVGFVSANVFYDGFLPDLTTEDTIDRVSAKGYATGYIGSAIQFALALGLVLFAEPLGLSASAAGRLGIAMAGLWWLGFSLFALRYLPEAVPRGRLPETLRGGARAAGYAKVGFRRVWETGKRLVGFPQLLLFLAAYLMYNDGIQTIIKMATSYAEDTLRLDLTTVMVTLLIVQVVAFGGAYFFGWLTDRIPTKRAILIAIAVYAGVTILAFRLPVGRALPFFGLGAVIGFVQGGAQSLSRSLYGSMIPEEASAEFYGFYSVVNKFSAIWGPLIFAWVRQTTGSGRNAILALIVLFVLGGLLLALVDVEEGRRSRLRWRFQDGEADAA